MTGEIPTESGMKTESDGSTDPNGEWTPRRLSDGGQNEFQWLRGDRERGSRASSFLIIGTYDLPVQFTKMKFFFDREDDSESRKLRFHRLRKTSVGEGSAVINRL